MLIDQHNHHQVGLPPIQDDIEAAWLEGKGELTEEQVGGNWTEYRRID